MRPVQSEKLRWLAPRGADRQTFANTVPVLEQLLSRSSGEAVYSVNTRSIYRAVDPAIGVVAIKELRFETRAARLRATTVRRYRVLCEYRAQATFSARGGDTPHVFGAAIEFDGPLIDRVFIIMTWIEDARTLSDAVREWSQDERETGFADLARHLVASAECGLVHGRHSSENILVTEEPLRFQVIDFSHAQLFRDYQATGFVRDVARIGARLLIENACSRAVVDTLFDAVVSAAPGNTVTAAQIGTECDAVLQGSKQAQRRLRQIRTFWRGWPFRLRL